MTIAVLAVRILVGEGGILIQQAGLRKNTYIRLKVYLGSQNCSNSHFQSMLLLPYGMMLGNQSS